MKLRSGHRFGTGEKKRNQDSFKEFKQHFGERFGRNKARFGYGIPPIASFQAPYNNSLNNLTLTTPADSIVPNASPFTRAGFGDTKKKSAAFGKQSVSKRQSISIPSSFYHDDREPSSFLSQRRNSSFLIPQSGKSSNKKFVSLLNNNKSSRRRSMNRFRFGEESEDETTESTVNYGCNCRFGNSAPYSSKMF